jgi:hypothetical protein
MMDEPRTISGTPGAQRPSGGPGDPPAPRVVPGPGEGDPFAQAGAQIAELMRRFIDEVGNLRRDAQVAADSARAERADAARIRQEAIRLRADAEAEAARIVDAARGEADRIRAQATEQASDAERVVHGVVDDLERAQQSLAELIVRFGEDVDGWTAPQGVAVVPDASDESSVA